jgi:hypothetical protein
MSPSVFSVRLNYARHGPREVAQNIHTPAVAGNHFFSLLRKPNKGLRAGLKRRRPGPMPIWPHSGDTIVGVPENAATRLDRVFSQLRLYEHPLLNFSARSKGEGVELIIQFKDASIPMHTYYLEMHPRDLDHPQFEWSFQRQLYDALHDYFVEMFIRTPQDRADRRDIDL